MTSKCWSAGVPTRALVGGLVLLTLLLSTACSKSGAQEQAGGGAKKKGGLEFPVETRPVESRQVEYSINAVGSLDAFERVAVTSRVAGAIERVMFTEGQVVSANQPL